MCDILWFLNFRYLPLTMQQIFFFILTVLESIENVLALFYHSFHIH